jgi:L-amino acid N-acyltransferase YncA
MSLMDSVGGVGPISVDASFEGRGIGRALMQAVLDYAKQNSIEQVRLLQDSFNVRSLSLYASLGFDVRESIGVMEARPATTADSSVRPLMEKDLPAIDDLSRRIYKVSRQGEIAAAAPHGFPVFVREHAGQITGYWMPGLFGHGLAETEADALALIGQAARQIPPEFAVFFCPLSLGNLYRAALKSGHRLRKIMTYMTVGKFERPERIWLPSVCY